MTLFDRIVIQSTSLIISLIAIIILIYYWRKRSVSAYYVFPPLMVYGLCAIFYTWILMVRPLPSIITTTVSSYLRFIELAVGLGIIVALGSKITNKAALDE